MTEKIVEAVNVVKTYSVGGMPLHAVDHLNFDISAGEFARDLGAERRGKNHAFESHRRNGYDNRRRSDGQRRKSPHARAAATDRLSAARRRIRISIL